MTITDAEHLRAIAEGALERAAGSSGDHGAGLVPTIATEPTPAGWRFTITLTGEGVTTPFESAREYPAERLATENQVASAAVMQYVEAITALRRETGP